MASPLRRFDLGTPRLRGRLRVPLTPLIDIVFLLVMFFLLSSSFNDLRVLRVGLTRTVPAGDQSASPSPADAADRRRVFITVAKEAGEGGSSSSVVRVDGEVVALSDLRARLDVLAEEGAASAVVRAREGTRLQDIIPVLDEARASRIEEVGILAGT